MIPVIFLHRKTTFVHSAIIQAQRFNRRVILLGDAKSQTNICPFFNIDDFISKNAERMAAVYEHMHAKPDANYRLANILRWFVIARFMKERNIHKVFTADSDLLLYTDVNECADDWGEFEVLLGAPGYQSDYRWAAPGHASYWTLNGLQQFCAFALIQYATDVGRARLQKKWTWHVEGGHGGGICDMTLLHLFQVTFPYMVSTLLRPVRDDTGELHAFDLNINYAENFVRDEYLVVKNGQAPYGSLKELAWANGRPYGNNRVFNERVRFDGLHLQAGAKRFMLELVNRRPPHGG